MSDLITGLDVGSSQIKCVVTEKQKNGSLRVITAFKHPSLGFRKGVLVDIEDASQIFEDITRELRSISRDAIRNIFINCQSEHTKVHVSRGIAAVSQPDKEIKQDDIDRAVQSSRAAKVLPNYKVLHTIVREYFVDEVGDIQTPLGMTGSRLEVSTLIVEAFAPHLDVLVQTAERGGAGIGGVIFNPFAAARSVLTKRQKELGVLMIDFGGGTTSLVVFEENKPLFAKSFPLGGNHITNDIAIGLRVPFDVAEKIKRAHGAVQLKGFSRRESFKISNIDPSIEEEFSRRFLSDIIEARVSQIIDVVASELKPLKHRFQFPAGVVITGGGVKLGGIVEAVKDGLKLPVQIGLPNISDFEINNPTFENMIDDAEFSNVIGLTFLSRDENKEKSFGALNSIKKLFKNLVP